MGKTTTPLAVKLIVGIISGNPDLFKILKKNLERTFSRTDFASPLFDFNQTHYYEKEMGKNLKRQFLSFERLISAEHLTRIKLYTNCLERKFASPRDQRMINIDPGYLTLSKLVLATTKNHAHRIYVAKDIFEEVTLNFQNGVFQPNPWTYPDYKSYNSITVFNEIRKIYRQQIEDKYGLSQLHRSI